MVNKLLDKTGRTASLQGVSQTDGKLIGIPEKDAYDRKKDSELLANLE